MQHPKMAGKKDRINDCNGKESVYYGTQLIGRMESSCYHGLVPLNKERLLSNWFICKTTETDLMEPPNNRNSIKINATEVTTAQKRI